MKISTKGRYALRLMIDIASQNQSAPVSLKDVSIRQNISIKYLEQIVSALARANLLRSIRGAQGGYILTKNPNEYSAKEILEALEGDINCVSCLQQHPNLCPRYHECQTVHFYEGLNQVIIDYLSHYTLQDFINSPLPDNYII